MAQRLTINFAKKPCYDIVFAQDFLGLPLELETLQATERRICIITDSNVEKLYAHEILNKIKDKCKKMHLSGGIFFSCRRSQQDFGYGQGNICVSDKGKF